MKVFFSQYFESNIGFSMLYSYRSSNFSIVIVLVLCFVDKPTKHLCILVLEPYGNLYAPIFYSGAKNTWNKKISLNLVHI